MEIRTLDFTLGVALGILLGIGLVWAAGKVRSWLGKSEVGRLARENQELKRRLADKDRHVSRMLHDAERLAEKLAQDKGLDRAQSGG